MNTQSKILKWSLIVGIVIVLNLFLNYSLSLIYKQPDYNAFCPSSQVNDVIENQQMCIDKGGQWNAYPQDKYIPTASEPLSIRPVGYCDTQYTCRNNYEAANKTYQRNVFVTLVILGAIMVLIGNFMGGNEVIATGLSFGGVLSFVIASMRYWGAADDYIRVGILAIALAILFWVAYKKFRTQI